jgi:hypothetical protein
MLTDPDIDLIVPVYINQRIVFDLVATLRDGISTVTRITESESQEKRSEANGGGSFGLGAALTNFVKLDIQKNRKKEDHATRGTHRSEERYHTPSSLFAQLLGELRETGMITTYKSGDVPEPGTLIEIEASLSISPVLKACENLTAAYETALIFNRQETPQIEKHTRKNNQGLQKLNKQENSAEYGVRIIKEIAHSMRSGNGLDLVTSKLEGDLTAVITIEQQFLNDAKMADLMDGRFKVAGKVTRAVTNEGETIDLLRNSQFGVLTPKFLAELFGLFEPMREVVQFPEPQTAVKAPAFQMIPIAIYT